MVGSFAVICNAGQAVSKAKTEPGHTLQSQECAFSGNVSVVGTSNYRRGTQLQAAAPWHVWLCRCLSLQCLLLSGA